jgi:hypothetical protein
MGVEIETSLEAAVGVALPPTSLMRARTIGEIASLIAGQMGGVTVVTETAPATATAEAASEVDFEALSDQDIERLVGGESESDATEAVGSAGR